MDMATALRELGVRDDTLTPSERERLDRDGFVAFPGILSPARIAMFNDRIDALLALEGAEAGKEVHQEPGTERLADLVNKGEEFLVCLTHPRVLAGIAHVLRGDLKLSSLNARAALPGAGLQGLHTDWNGPVEPGDYYVCNSIWLLDDFTGSNGATRVVPGSHRSRQVPEKAMADRKAHYPGETRLIAPAGTVVVFNSHVWHGGSLNESPNRRRAAHAYFCRRDQPPQSDQRKLLRPETLGRMSPAVRYLLDV